MKVSQEEIIITSDKVLFFDMDGTLVDTNLANFSAYEKAIGSVIQTEKKLIYNPQQRFNRIVLKATFPDLTNTDYERIILAKEGYYEKYLYLTKLVTEKTDILLKYSTTNHCFLVTNCRKDRALTTLNYYGLTDKFTKIFYREFDDNDKKVNKFQNALSILGVQPNIVIAFENEKTEIADAKKVGIKLINPKIA